METSVFSAMQTDKPYKTYKKTILGKVYVTVLNPFSEKPEGLILQGNQKKNEEGSLVDVWNQKEDVFFKRMNKKHLESGVVVEYTRPGNVPISEEEKYNTLSDEEMDKLLDGKFLAISAAYNKMTSEAAVYRLLELAREKDLSEKIISHIESRLAEIQGVE